jgi:hypothetical protein
MSNAVIDKVEKFLTIHLGLITVSAAIFWSFHYFSPVADLVSLVSWQASDEPWVAIGPAQQLWGVHFFGDLQTLRSWGSVWNPYSESIGFPAQHLPTGQLFMNLLSIIPLEILLFLYLVFSVALLFFAIRTLANSVFRVGFWKYAQLFIVFSVLGLPMLIDFDRGNLQTIALAGTVFFFGYGLRGKWGVAIVWLLFAASIKPYLLVFSIAFLTKRNFRIHAFLGSAFCFVNVILMQAFSGDFVEGFRSMWGANARYTTEYAVPYIANSGSLVGSAHRFSEFAFGLEIANQLLVSVIWALPIASFLLVILGMGIWYRTNLPLWVRLMGALSINSVAQPASASYNWGWVGVVVIIFLVDLMSKIPPGTDSSSPWFLQILAFLALVPTWIYLDSPSGDLRQNAPYMILSPIIVSSLIYWLVRSFRKSNSTI